MFCTVIYFWQFKFLFIAILVYRTLRRSSKKPVKLLHMVLHLLAFIMSVIGLKAVFDSHNLLASPTPNLYSMHSWIGLVTVIIFTAQVSVFYWCYMSYHGAKNDIELWTSSLPFLVMINSSFNNFIVRFALLVDDVCT